MPPAPPPRPSAPEVLTIGHSSRTIGELLDLLRGHRVGLLVDVRRFPRSRRHPWFSDDAFREAVEGAGLGYVHEPELGGSRTPRPDSVHVGWALDAFRGYADRLDEPAVVAALDRLEARSAAMAERGLRIAACCAEASPEACHRRILADALVARGVPVAHVIDAGPARPHEPPAFASFGGGRVTYPAPHRRQLELFDAGR